MKVEVSQSKIRAADRSISVSKEDQEEIFFFSQQQTGMQVSAADQICCV